MRRLAALFAHAALFFLATSLVLADNGIRPGFWALLTRANTWVGAQTFTQPTVVSINPNATGDPTGSGSSLIIIGADGVAARSSVLAFGSSPSFSAYRADGTAASPSAVAANAILGGAGGAGYNGATYAGGSSVQIVAAEAFTSTATGTFIRNTVITPGTTTTVPASYLYSSGLFMKVPIRHAFTQGIAAAGTTLATGTALTSDINFVSTVASGTGVVLPAFDGSQTGTTQRVEVFNEGANALAVYPNSASAQIRAGTTTNTAGAAVTLASGGHATFYPTTAALVRQGP